MTQRIAVVGLGKLGLCLAAVYAAKGIGVVGVDVQEAVVSRINAGEAPFFEPGLDGLIAEVGGKGLVATTRHATAVEQGDVTIVLTATPSRPDGSFSNEQVEAALEALGTALARSDKPYHLFVISSTVNPGSILGRFVPLLERVSGRRLNEGFGLCYDPDFVALGNVIEDFRNPEIIIVGESDAAAGDRLVALHRRICENEPYIGRMSLISGEIAKVSLNAYITLKISFANTLANICENIPGADVDAITRAIGHDRRISPHYFRGGLAFGGTCFPRDTWAFRAMADRFGGRDDLIRAVEAVNTHQDDHLARRVVELAAALETRRVGVLGLAFKPRTPVITRSPAIALVKHLLAEGLSVVVHDPLAMEAARAQLGPAVTYAASAGECLAGAPLCVLTLPSAELAQGVRDHQGPSPVTVIDCWRVLDGANLAPGVAVIALGRAAPAGQAA